jgi:hypothetical protein
MEYCRYWILLKSVTTYFIDYSIKKIYINSIIFITLYYVIADDFYSNVVFIDFSLFSKLIFFILLIYSKYFINIIIFLSFFFIIRFFCICIIYFFFFNFNSLYGSYWNFSIVSLINDINFIYVYCDLLCIPL